MLELFHKSRQAAPASDPGADATRALDEILRAAVAEGASDIHFEPKEDGLVVRFRLDGEMREHGRLPVARREARSLHRPR